MLYEDLQVPAPTGTSLGSAMVATALNWFGGNVREPWTKVDCLLFGAMIEARSCERFTRLLEVLDDPEVAHLLADLGAPPPGGIACQRVPGAGGSNVRRIFVSGEEGYDKMTAAAASGSHLTS